MNAELRAAIEARRRDAIRRALEDAALMVIQLKATAPVPTERVLDALYEIPATEQLTVAQLAVLVDQCGMRLRLEAVPA